MKKELKLCLLSMAAAAVLTSCTTYIYPHYEVCNTIDYAPFKENNIDVSPYACDREDVEYVGTLSMYISATGAISKGELTESGELKNPDKYRVEHKSLIYPKAYHYGSYEIYNPSYEYATKQFAKYAAGYEAQIDAIYQYQITEESSVNRYGVKSVTGYRASGVAVKFK